MLTSPLEAPALATPRSPVMLGITVTDNNTHAALWRLARSQDRAQPWWIEVAVPSRPTTTLSLTVVFWGQVLLEQAFWVSEARWVLDS